MADGCLDAAHEEPLVEPDHGFLVMGSPPSDVPHLRRSTSFVTGSPGLPAWLTFGCPALQASTARLGQRASACSYLLLSGWGLRRFQAEHGGRLFGRRPSPSGFDFGYQAQIG
jgi:hypothetical protein